uniref:Uncharacterized protein n=1 Tax=Physcomitrium patens TaxID=3218 RepID=A0A2K1KFQ7_PHYPA|nr:hypothetical protein PHYPA_008988 [Physcomitrium patens]
MSAFTLQGCCWPSPCADVDTIANSSTALIKLIDATEVQHCFNPISMASDHNHNHSGSWQGLPASDTTDKTLLHDFFQKILT